MEKYHQQNNKLIAEFMGYKLMSCSRGKAWDIGKSIPSKDHLFPIQGVLHTGNELKFHKEWNWLMPVVEKIESLGYVFTIQGGKAEYGKMISETQCFIREDKLSSTYKAVVEFISFLHLETTTAEEYEKLPQEIKNIVDSWDDNKELYTECNRIQKELEQKGWTCDYGLDGMVYDVKRKEYDGI